MLLEVFVASFIVMLAALGGAVSFWKILEKIIEKNLGFLISFTAGLFLFVSYELGREALAHSENTESGLFWILSGIILIWVIFKLIPHSHEHGHNHDKNEEKKLDIRKILTGNGIHNIGDGVLLAAAFSVDFNLGLITTVSVFIHELAQETSIFFVLRKAGYSIKKSLLINFSISGTILIGSLGGVLLLSNFTTLETPLLGISAGAFLIVVLQDLIPHSLNQSRKDKCLPYHFLFFLLGLGLMFSISLIAPHSHEYHSKHNDNPHHENDDNNLEENDHHENEFHKEESH